MKARVFRIASYINEFALCGILFFIPISKAILESLLGAAFLGFLVKKVIRPDFSFLKNKTNLFLVLFMLFSALSLINSGKYLEKSLLALFFKWGNYVLLYFMFLDVFKEKDKAKKAFFIFLISAGLVSLNGVFQFIFGFDFFRGKGMIDMQNGVHALCISFNNYNCFSTYLIILLSLFVSLVYKTRSYFRLVSTWFFIILSVFSLIFNFSRGGWLGFLVSFIIFMIFSGKARIFSSVFLLLCFLVLVIPQARQRFMLFFGPGGDTNRFETWAAAFDMIKRAPFLGMGLGTFMDYFPKEKTWLIVGYAHNCFLQIWAETGIFSLVSFCSFLFLFFKDAIKTYLRNRDFLILGLTSGLAGFVVHSFFDTHFYSLQLSYLFWGLAGLLAAVAAQNKESL